MLENYEKLPNGVIKQIERKPFTYGFDYSNAYNNLGELGMQMAYLRLGYLLGKINSNIESLLDVGYGNGCFLRAASKKIPQCYGNDLTQEYLPPENVTFVDSIFDRHYSVITMFDVLEHFSNIYDIEHLKCDYLYVSMPWCHYHSDEWFMNWKHRKPDEHLYHFNGTSLVNFMEEIGFKPVDISNIEDCIRTPIDGDSNILSGIFKKV